MKILYFRVKKNGKVTSLEQLERTLIKHGLPVTVGFMVAGSQPVFAANGNVKDALKPLITALQDLAEPVAYAFMIYGGIKYISGHASEGKKTLSNAIGGYILIQWIPWIFSIIRQVGK